MSKRTTIHLADLKAKANNVFRASENEYADGRRHIQSFVESLLMEAGQYKGFGYLTKDRVAPGKSFGIEFDASNKPTFYDQSRVCFY
jgi:hypothetical protein